MFMLFVANIPFYLRSFYLQHNNIITMLDFIIRPKYMLLCQYNGSICILLKSNEQGILNVIVNNKLQQGPL